ncbi:hypothetical protein GCM10010411_76260 [Actinomadura fulvescens]|uniref:Transposase DDE domain-containing protein n=1 Tax=Actinomadura fulvescens TaxID=46160 RepID=A0ABP6CUA7_9ACTN
MRAALEELARRAAPQKLIGLVTEDWGRRYGRAARLGKNPTRPRTRIKDTGEDANLLLRYVRIRMPELWDGPQIQALRQIFLQNYWIDSRDRVQWRVPGEAGLPPSSIAIVSPYDLTARYARRAGTRWRGYLAHVTETCDEGTVRIITDVTTTRATVNDSRSLPEIHTRLKQRGLLPSEHLVDGGYTSVELRDRAARDHQVDLVGPVKAKATRRSRKGNVFTRDAFTIDWDHQKVTCPQGNTSPTWLTSPSLAPYVQVNFSKRDCRDCPIKTQCTRSAARLLTFLPHDLHELQTAARAEQQTREWKMRYAKRAGIESTISEFVQGHGMRQCRYRSQDKAHVQHVLTAIAVNIERINVQLTSAPERHPRPPTALQGFLDWQYIPRQRSWRATG